MANRFGASLRGLSEAKAAFQRLPDVSRIRVGEASQLTGFAILQRAKANVRQKSSTLHDALDTTYSDRTGIAKVGVRRGVAGPHGELPGHYAHLVEFGHEGPHPAGAHPFMIPAAEAEREPYLRRCHDAGANIERDMSTVGGSFL